MDCQFDLSTMLNTARIYKRIFIAISRRDTYFVNSNFGIWLVTDFFGEQLYGIFAGWMIATINQNFLFRRQYKFAGVA